MTNLSRSLILGCSMLALSACGPEDLGSPGANGDINVDIDNSVTNPAPTPTPSPTPTPTGVQPAAGCPSLGTADGLLDSGTITGPTGTYRVCTLPSTFTASTTLPYVQGVLYELSGRVNVGRDDGATADASDGVTGTPVDLTIEAGAILFGAEGPSGGSYIVVHRGSQMHANGTLARPIVFTAEADVLGQTQDDTSARWGGIVLLGRAPVSDCAVGGVNPADRATCVMRVEGIADNVPVFGGNTPADNSGSLTYVQIRYSGFTLDLGSELQSLTLGGVGSGTTLDYIQSYNSSDDGTEFFGGHVNMKHFIAVGAEDDSLDLDSGVQANIQYVAVIQRDGVGDKALENDSPPDDKGPGTTPLDAGPRTLTQVSNFSFWATSTGSVIQTRGGSDLTLANGVIYKPTSSGRACLDNNGNVGTPPGSSRGSNIILHSVELDCTTNAATDAAIAAGSGNTFQTNTLTGKFLDGDNEMNYTPVFAAMTLSSFFANTSYIGAVPRPAGADLPWTRGWTCDSVTVNFGSGRSCKALPVYS